MIVCREERLPRKLYRCRLCDCDFQDLLYETAYKIYAFKVISVIVIKSDLTASEHKLLLFGYKSYMNPRKRESGGNEIK